MYAAERLAKIRRIIRDKKRIDVATLSKLLAVSEVTIRRDLVKLENEGYIIKTYGGAVLQELVDENPRNGLKPGVSLDDDPYLAEKEQIGKIAANLVEDYQIIFLGPGTTCYQIAVNLIQKKNLTIVTNNLYVISLLQKAPAIKVIAVGGEINYARNCLVGPIAQDCLKHLHTNISFVSVDGINLDRGYTLNDFDVIGIIKAIKLNSDEMVLAADYSKFDKIALTSIGDLTYFKKVITNSRIPAEYKNYFFENCIGLYTTMEIEA
ncbi:MAG: DeoR/GlpR transcriptional regulator [Firmicutes bacterium]|nr:DeoR/GlpR transcriptional regulator [Bacillota bacterium]